MGKQLTLFGSGKVYEQPLPLGRQRKGRIGDYVWCMHVIGYENGHNAWQEIWKRYEPLTYHYDADEEQRNIEYEATINLARQIHT